jgi:hypothetical protein
MTAPQKTETRTGVPQPKLPHERDESTATPPAPGPAMKRAASDVATGKIDTERRGQARCNFEPADCAEPSQPQKERS